MWYKRDEQLIERDVYIIMSDERDIEIIWYLLVTFASHYKYIYIFFVSMDVNQTWSTKPY